MSENTKDNLHALLFVLTLIVFILVIVFSYMAYMPRYRVWSREMKGRAELAEAEWSKKIQIEQAKANLESEILNAQAEVERAKGASEAIAIEGGSLTENYIRYLWVRQQSNLNDKTVIYLPTEAGLPVLEANRIGE